MACARPIRAVEVARPVLIKPSDAAGETVWRQNGAEGVVSVLPEGSVSVEVRLLRNILCRAWEPHSTYQEMRGRALEEAMLLLHDDGDKIVGNPPVTAGPRDLHGLLGALRGTLQLPLLPVPPRRLRHHRRRSEPQRDPARLPGPARHRDGP